MTRQGPRSGGRVRDRFWSMGPVVRKFIESTCAHTKGQFKGKPVVCEPWQIEFIDELFLVDRKTNRRVYSEGLWGLPAKNGKSTIGAALALEGLTFDPNPETFEPEPGPEVYLAANARKQAGIVGNVVRVMARDSPILSRVLNVGKYDVENPRSDGALVWLAADEATVHGVNPSRTIYDELGAAPNAKLLTTLQKSTAARLNPLLLNITHWGFERYGPLGDLYDKLWEVPDVEQRYTPGVECVTIARDREAGVLYQWHGLFEEHRDKIDDPELWLACNPASWIEAQYLQREFRKLDASDFVTFHLNGYAAPKGVWLPDGLWHSLGNRDLDIPPGSKVWVGVDASHSGDTTGVVVDWPYRSGSGRIGHRLTSKLFTLEDTDVGGSMIEQAAVYIRETICRRYRVEAICYDPWRFEPWPADEMAADGLPMESFPQSHARMVPACKTFYESCVENLIEHDARREFLRHVTNAVTRKTARGVRVDKEISSGKIDLCVAAIMAVEIAETDMIDNDGTSDFADLT